MTWEQWSYDYWRMRYRRGTAVRSVPPEAAVYEAYVALAERYGWTQQQVDEQDADYIDYLLGKLRAERDIERREERRRTRGG